MVEWTFFSNAQCLGRVRMEEGEIGYGRVEWSCEEKLSPYTMAQYVLGMYWGVV